MSIPFSIGTQVPHPRIDAFGSTSSCPAPLASCAAQPSRTVPQPPGHQIIWPLDHPATCPPSPPLHGRTHPHRPQHRNTLRVVHPLGHGLKVRLMLSSLEVLRPDQHPRRHRHLEVHDPPHAVAHLRLVNRDPSTLVEPSQHTPSELHIALQLCLQPHHPHLRRIDPDLPIHRGQHFRFHVRWAERGIRHKHEPLRVSRPGRHQPRIPVKKGARQYCQHLERTRSVRIFLLFALPLL